MDLIELARDPFTIVMALIVMNFAAFAAFGIDKAKAETQAWRISEASLLQLAFFGGIAGAYAGRALFRHKTRKEPFSTRLHRIAGFQLVAVAFLIVFLW